MAHQLEMNDGAASFAYADTVGSAWHRLGVEMEGLSATEDILEACNGDYHVHRDTLWAVDPTDDESHLPTGKSITWREREVDGEVEKQVLGIVGNDYRVIQNRAAVNLALELASLAPDAPSIDCAGVLDEGRRFFATIPLPEIVIDPQGINDRFGRNLVVVTGHDATQSLEIVNGVTRAVCANTVEAALRGSKRKIQIRHVGEESLPVAEAKSKLGFMLSADEEFERIAHEMLGKDCKWGLVERIADKIWPLSDGANDRTKTNHEIRLTKIQKIWDSPRGAGGVGENHYAVFQTLTEYMQYDQHIVGKSNQYNRAKRAVESPGFSRRVHNLAEALQSKQPARAVKAG